MFKSRKPVNGIIEVIGNHTFVIKVIKKALRRKGYEVFSESLGKSGIVAIYYKLK